MKTLEVYVEIISYFGQMHDFVVRVDGKYRNRPGLRFLSQINASERHPKVTISIRIFDLEPNNTHRTEISRKIHACK